MEPSTHDYLSTACYHGRHDDCRLVCKFCPAGCRCECHHDRDLTEQVSSVNE